MKSPPGAENVDAADLRILAVLQDDAALSIAEIGERVGLSANACWRRIKRLDDEGFIRGRVALLDAERRAKQKAAADELKAQRAALDALGAALDPLNELADALLNGAMLAAGFHRHKGQWRKRRGEHDSPEAARSSGETVWVDQHSSGVYIDRSPGGTG